MSDLFAQLKADFPRDAISWRAQSMKADGTAAMALAYIDARDVMHRLDEVCGPENWQCRYPHAGAKTVCEIGIFHNGQWIWKADGAGDSDIEAEKGALSDAFKRAAVRWGIGRYLYDLASPWVDCESYTNHQGKKVWKRWTADPWSKIRNSNPAPSQARVTPANHPVTRTDTGPAGVPLSTAAKAFITTADMARTKDAIAGWVTANTAEIDKQLAPDEASRVKDHARDLWRRLPEQEAA